MLQGLDSKATHSRVGLVDVVTMCNFSMIDACVASAVAGLLRDTASFAAQKTGATVNDISKYATWISCLQPDSVKLACSC